MISVTRKSPHIHSRDSLAKMFWKMNGALSPFVISSFVSYGWTAFQIIAVSLMVGIATGEVTARFCGKTSKLSNGNTVFITLLLAMMLPAGTSLGVVALGSFFAIFLGKEIFGGIGASPFHGALVGRMLLEVFFYAEMHRFASPAYTFYPDMLMGRISGFLGMSSILAIAVGAAIAITQKQFFWEIPFLFLGVYVCLDMILGVKPVYALFSSELLFVAFFLVTDSASTPHSRRGCLFFAVVAACLSVVLSPEPRMFHTLCFAILLSNALVPWMDAFTKPKKTGMLQ